jgi:GTPase SAR1 family protein
MSTEKSNSTVESALSEAAAAVDNLADPDVKIILLGDSAVGKSKLVERFLMNNFIPRQMSTYALTVFRYQHKQQDKNNTATNNNSNNTNNTKTVEIDFWDTGKIILRKCPL